MSTKNENTPEGNAPELSDAEMEKAKKEGLKEAVKSAYSKTALIDNQESAGDTFSDMRPGIVDVTKLEPLLRLSPDAFEQAVSEDEKETAKAGYPKVFGEEDVKGLLCLERAGQNRTTYVKALLNRLKIDSPYDVTDAGPPYTNDQTSVTSFAKE